MICAAFLGSLRRSIAFSVRNAATQMISFSTTNSGQGCRVYVGNIPFSVSEIQVIDHMKSCGTIVAGKLIRNSLGQSKGCAIVEYSSKDEAMNAITKLHSSTIQDRIIFLREDKEKHNFTKVNRRFIQQNFVGEDGVAVPLSTSRLYVKNLPFTVTIEQVRDHFNRVGETIDVKLPLDDEGRVRGYAFVEYQTPSEAYEAMKVFHNTPFLGRKLFIREDREDVFNRSNAV